MARHAALLVGLVLSLSASAQYQGTGVIAGMVVEGASNEPVKKSVVTLRWPGPPACFATARTGADGRFIFDGLPAGRFTLSTGAPLPATAELMLGSGEARTNLVLRVMRITSLSGRVFDSDGDPIPRATVEIYRPVWRRGRFELQRAATAEASLRGEFRLTGLRPGRYLAAATGGEANTVFEPVANQAVFPRAYYGGASEWSRSAPILLEAGQAIAGVDFQLTPSRMLVWSGRLSGVPPGSTQSEISVSVSPLDPPGHVTQSVEGLSVGADGQFRWRGLPGVYAVVVSAEAGGKTLRAVERLDLTRDRTEISLALMPPLNLAG
ncbi:MAG: carboxypeptidase-like regulatory domain-containing protein, partial [Acidobacteria bacterium]|nr:carboxypeptidase-like regulatory domain-containing protein [Acidobacteriota bacterium]